MNSDSIGVLGAIVWPTYIGFVLVDGSEPISHPDYVRGPITWHDDGDGKIGTATVFVPPGEWEYVIYCYEPASPRFMSSQKLANTIHTSGGNDASITLSHITFADFAIRNQALRVLGL